MAERIALYDLTHSEILPDLVFRDVGHLHATWQEALDG
jgi:hypothetical protein